VANQEVNKVKNVHKQDLLLVSSMLVIYAICCIVAVANSTVWIKKDREIISANATATQAVVVTKQANATATVVYCEQHFE
jgi:cell division protein FtsL